MCVFGGNIPITGDNDGRILSWDVNTMMANRPVGILKHKIGISALACNSKYVFSGAENKTFMVWEVKESEHQAGLSLCAALPDFQEKDSTIQQIVATDELIFVLYRDTKIQVLKADNVEEVVADSGKLNELGADKGEATCIAHCATRNELYVGDNKKWIHIFDATTLQPKGDGPLKTHSDKPCVSAAVSPDGSKLAIGDGNSYVTIFDLEARAQLTYIYKHKSKILNVEFTPDNEWVAALGFDQALSLGFIADPK
jgi:WD40 repeat protein